MPARSCPSCRHRLSPLAMECPICGLPLTRTSKSRPLLFQISARQANSDADAARQVLAAPALGRVTPVILEPPVADDDAIPESIPGGLASSAALPIPTPALDNKVGGDSFWPLAKLEFLEALTLVGLNLALALLTWFQTDSLWLSYTEFWRFLLPMHFILSWAVLMVPLVLMGQSPLMGRYGLHLETSQSERRLAFSLFHLLSLCFFPLSFVTMVLTPNHRTLAELLTGQDIVVQK